jgi:predicted ABC-type ATPase
VPSIIIIAGPNGAGKTTFGDEYLSTEERKFEFVNAEDIARGLDAQGIRARFPRMFMRRFLTQNQRVDSSTREFGIVILIVSCSADDTSVRLCDAGTALVP